MKFNSFYRFPSFESCSICIVGLGYVGLPLAISFSSKKECVSTSIKLNRKVIGYDINQERIEELNKNIDRTSEVSKKELEDCRDILFTSNHDLISNSEVFIITVPTPINNDKDPDLFFLEKATEMVALAISKFEERNKNNDHNKRIIIYESTVFPGATEEICVPIIEKITGLEYNKGFYCGYSPERINPSDKLHKLESIVKVTSGSNREVGKWIDKLYSSIIEAGTYLTESIKIAEAAKVIENTQRDLNIALINELAIIFKLMNIDTLKVLEAAGTKWNFLPFRPGLVGGHCIGIDPYYLTYKSKSLGYTPKVVLSGREINDGMVNWIFEQIINELNKRRIKIEKCKVLILGITFKENCSDVRNSKTMELAKKLSKEVNSINIVDPLVDVEELKSSYQVIVNNVTEPTTKYDVCIISVPHNDFKEKECTEYLDLLKPNGFIFDVKSMIKEENKNIIRL